MPTTFRIADICLSLPVLTLAWLVAVATFGWTACNSTDCKDDKYYVHDRYCWKDNGEDRATHYAKGIVTFDIFYCTNKATPGGNRAAKDNVAYTNYGPAPKANGIACDRDCTKDDKSTGVKKIDAEKLSEGTAQGINTECTGSS